MGRTSLLKLTQEDIQEEIKATASVTSNSFVFISLWSEEIPASFDYVPKLIGVQCHNPPHRFCPPMLFISVAWGEAGSDSQGSLYWKCQRMYALRRFAAINPTNSQCCCPWGVAVLSELYSLQMQFHKPHTAPFTIFPARFFLIADYCSTRAAPGEEWGLNVPEN